MNAEDFPRVLVVTSNNFNSITGGGITLTNLFRGWPANRIANVHEDSTPEDRTVCEMFYRLSHDDIQWMWPFSILQPKGNVSEGLAGPLGGETASQMVSRLILGDGIPRVARISPALRRWIDLFKPELIYSFLGSMAQIRLTRALTEYTGAPLAIHIMDDWPEVIYRRGLLGRVLRRIVIKEFKETIDASQLRLCICDEMSREYDQRYGCSFLSFHNALDMEIWRAGARKQWANGSPFVISYVGSILAEGQCESLRDICLAVQNIARSGLSVEMRIYSPRGQAMYLQRDNLPAVRFAPPPASDEIVQVLAHADLLVLPFNFASAHARYLRFSMPTKIPAYMASGSPILVYGPPNIAAVNYAKSFGWGFVASQPDLAQLEKSIRDLISDSGSREALARRAQELAHTAHDAAKVRASFQSVLVGAARH